MLSGLVENRILAVDWDEREVRVVHAAIRRSQLRVLAVQSFSIPDDVSPGNIAAFGKLLREFLDHERIGTRAVVATIPRDQATVKRLRGLPPAAPEDLPGVIAVQFARELSFPASQAAIDFAELIPDANQTTRSTLAVAVQREVVDDYVAILRAAGLKPERVGFRPFANRIAVNAVLGAGANQRVLFVDVTPSFTEIDVIHEGHLVFARAASVQVPREPGAAGTAARSRPSEPEAPIRLSAVLGGGQRGSELSDVVNSLVVEVVRSIEACRADDPGATITHVVIGGSTGVEERLAEALRDRLDLQAELFNPAARFGWDADRGAAACGFATGLGLVVGQADAKEPYFDFLHPKKMVTAAEKQLRKLPIAAAAAALLLLAVGVAYFSIVWPKKQELAQWTRKLDDARKNESAMKDLRKLIEKMDGAESEQIVWLDELHDVLRCLPPVEEMVLDDVEMRQKDQRIGLKIRAKSRETLTDTVDRLQAFRLPGEESRHFRAELGATKTEPGAYLVSGSIEVTVVSRRPAPDVEGESRAANGP